MLHKFESFISEQLNVGKCDSHLINESVTHKASNIPLPGATVTKAIYDGDGVTLYFDNKEDHSIYAFTYDYSVMLQEYDLLEQYEALKTEFSHNFLLDGKKSYVSYIQLCFEQDKEPYFLPKVKSEGSHSYYNVPLEDLRKKINL